MQSKPHRDPTKHLMDIVAHAISALSNKQSLITVTSATLSPDEKKFSVGISVLPESFEVSVLEFLNRNQDMVRGEIKKHIRINPLPFIVFHIDIGEKNRRKIQTLSARNKDESLIE